MTDLKTAMDVMDEDDQKIEICRILELAGILDATGTLTPEYRKVYDC